MAANIDQNSFLPAPIALAARNIKLRNQDNQNFAYNEYPGLGFGKAKPLFNSQQISSLDCNNTSMSKTKDISETDIVLIKECDCTCMKRRSDSFYDIFLASSVKETAEYQQILKEREKRRKKPSPDQLEEVCASFFGFDRDLSLVILKGEQK